MQERATSVHRAPCTAAAPYRAAHQASYSFDYFYRHRVSTSPYAKSGSYGTVRMRKSASPNDREICSLTVDFTVDKYGTESVSCSAWGGSGQSMSLRTNP